MNKRVYTAHASTAGPSRQGNCRGKKPTLVWKDEESEFILLGYAHGTQQEFESDDALSIMFRVHENELSDIVGRTMGEVVNLPAGGSARSDGC